MNTQTFNNTGNSTHMDFDQHEHITLETVLERVELEEWLIQADNELTLDELELLQEEV